MHKHNVPAMNKWWDSLDVGRQMGYWHEFREDGESTNVVIERAFAQYMKTFKLRVA